MVLYFSGKSWWKGERMHTKAQGGKEQNMFGGRGTARVEEICSSRVGHKPQKQVGIRLQRALNDRQGHFNSIEWRD